MRAVILVLAVALGGCAATIPPVEVTRFHTGQAMAVGPLTVVPAGGGNIQTLEFRTYAVAVGQELARLGYPESADDKSPWIAEIDFSRGTRTDFAKRSPVSIGIGGGSFGGGFGIGVGTSFGVGGSGSKETVITRLSVRLLNRFDGKPVWEGRAETQAPSRAAAAQPGLAAEKLAKALFSGFPGKSGETITVP
jgi:hypothetical protein